MRGWKIILIILGVIILITAIYGGYKGYEKAKTNSELMPISSGGGGMCNKVCIEQGHSGGCFVPSIPQCDCMDYNLTGNIKDYRYCENASE